MGRSDESEYRRRVGEALRPYATAENRKIIAAALGVDIGAVSQWASGQIALRPSRIFAIEDALELRGNEISARLGFMRTGTALSVEAAINVDDALSERDRETLRRLYRDMRDAARQ